MKTKIIKLSLIESYIDNIIPKKSTLILMTLFILGIYLGYGISKLESLVFEKNSAIIYVANK